MFNFSAQYSSTSKFYTFCLGYEVESLLDDPIYGKPALLHMHVLTSILVLVNVPSPKLIHHLAMRNPTPTPLQFFFIRIFFKVV